MLIGCSGWSYEDWVGRFYPVALAKRKEEWLRYYASYFGTVEINSTFHRPPTEIMVNGWIRKGHTLKDFEYSVKMPRIVTHESMVRLEGEKASIDASAFEETCARPLDQNGLLGTVLIQLSPSFHLDPGSLVVLEKVLETLDTERFRYAVEFRHRSWLDSGGVRLNGDVARLLSNYNAAVVQVDGPGFPPVHDVTADHAYLRFHGHDASWTDEEREEDGRQSRYDYFYGEEELLPWKEIIGRLDQKVKEVRVYFNNNGRAKGAKNAFQMMDLLSIPHREKEVHVQDQSTLASFVPLSK